MSSNTSTRIRFPPFELHYIMPGIRAYLAYIIQRLEAMEFQ